MVARSGIHVAPVPGSPPIGTAPADARLVLGAEFGTGGACLSGGSFSASSTTMAFTSAPSVFQIPDSALAGAVYHSPIDITVVTPAAGPAAGSRIDSIYAIQRDYEKGDGTSRASIELQAGTEGSAPVPPSLPTGALRLANVAVPANASKATDCTISYLVPPATLAVDGPVTASKALLDLMTGSYVGQLAWAKETFGSTTLTLTYRWNGTAWKRWDSDWVPFTPTVGNATTAGISGRFRFAAGRVVFEWACSFTGNTGSGAILVTLPFSVDDSLGFQVVGAATLSANGPQMLQPQVDNKTRIVFRYQFGNSGAYFTTTSPVTLASGNGFRGQVVYDPA